MKPVSESGEAEKAVQGVDISAGVEDKPSTTELKKRQKARQVANAINAIEGVPISEYAVELSKRWANGELTGEQLKQLLKAHHHKIVSSVKEPDIEK